MNFNNNISVVCRKFIIKCKKSSLNKTKQHTLLFKISIFRWNVMFLGILAKFIFPTQICLTWKIFLFHNKLFVKHWIYDWKYSGIWFQTRITRILLYEIIDIQLFHLKVRLKFQNPVRWSLVTNYKLLFNFTTQSI